MKYLFSLFFVFSSIFSFSQALDWVGFNQSDLVVYGRHKIIDKDENIYMAGEFRDTTDMDPSGSQTLFYSSTQDVFLAKFDSSSNLIWATQFKGNSNESVRSLKQDSDGNIYIGGIYYDSMNFDASQSNALLVNPNDPTFEFYLAKYDSAGNFLWAKTFGSLDHDDMGEMVIDNDNNIYIEGLYRDSIDMDPGSGVFSFPKPTNNPYARFILKLDSSGNFIWANSLDAPVSFINYETDNNGYLYATGFFTQAATIDFDTRSGVQNVTGDKNNQFIYKLDTAGNFVWVKLIDGEAPGHLLTIDKNYDLVICGNFMTSFDMDPGPGTSMLDAPSGLRDSYIIKFDSAGTFKWGNAIKSRQNNLGYNAQVFILKLAIDKFNNIYPVGYFSDTADFDPSNNDNLQNTITPWAYDGFALKLTNEGKFKWVTQFAQTNPNNPLSVEVNNINVGNENIYISGNYIRSTDFDPGPGTFLDSSGSELPNNFILRLKQDKTIEAIIDSNVCDSFIFNTTTYYDDKTVMVLDTTASGQDSATYINFTVNHPKNTLLTEVACDSFTLNGTTYYTSNTYTQNLTTASGCDSIITLNLTIKNSANTVFNETACDSFTLNSTTYFTSGTYYQNYTAANGCDSTVTLNLTVNHSATETLTETACFSFELNDSIYTESGTYTQHLNTTAGCDSTIVLNLTINTVDTALHYEYPHWISSATNASFQWLDCNDFSEISGKTDSISNIDIAGVYALEISQNGCIDTTDCVFIIFENVGKNTFPTAINAYPNPTSSEINIDLGTTYNNVKIEVQDAMGRRVRYMEIETANEFTLNLDGAAGIYYITITNGSYTTKLKVIKQQ